jgi:hypothetical protein
MSTTEAIVLWTVMGLTLAYGAVATIAAWMHRPPVGRDPNTWHYRSVRRMAKERQR